MPALAVNLIGQAANRLQSRWCPACSLRLEARPLAGLIVIRLFLGSSGLIVSIP
jgi:hypothetical protein